MADDVTIDEETTDEAAQEGTALPLDTVPDTTPDPFTLSIVPATVPDQGVAGKLTAIGYSDFEALNDEEGAAMLYVAGRFICGVTYALALSDEALKALIDETVPIAQAGEEA